MYVLKNDKNKKNPNAEYIQFCKIAIKFIKKKYTGYSNILWNGV